MERDVFHVHLLLHHLVPREVDFFSSQSVQQNDAEAKIGYIYR